MVELRSAPSPAMTKLGTPVTPILVPAAWSSATARAMAGSARSARKRVTSSPSRWAWADSDASVTAPLFSRGCSR
jgi:hypothetical protein